MLQLLVIVYLLFVLAVLIFQRRLIYFPTKIPADRVVQAAAEHGFVPWKNPAGQIIGWKLPATSSPIASVLITHGNAGCAIDRGYLTGPIHDAAPVDVDMAYFCQASSLSAFRNISYTFGLLHRELF